NYNSHFWVLGVIMVFIGFISITLLNKKIEKRAKNAYEAWKENLIQTGLKIEVDLSKVKIKSSNYREVIINNEYSGQSKYKALDALAGNDTLEYNSIKESILIYETQLLEKTVKFFSPIIPKDEITLQFLLNNQKHTYIYQDKLDQNNYFFDIEFLYA
ncbi:MAG TPA: hypothetical protein VK796_03830, partial [Cytophaga sp.]|nr:hypothetical protein [Cytophaga sp.]